MSLIDPASATAATALDPTTPGEALARIATERPDLRANIARNPALYPELRVWLAGLGDPAVDAALVAGPATGPDAGPGAAQTTPDELTAVRPLPPTPAQAAAAQSVPAVGPAAGSTPPPPPVGAGDTVPIHTAPLNAVPVDDTVLGPAGPYGTAGLETTAFETTPPRRSRRPLVLGVTAGVALLLVGGGAFAWNTIFSKLGGASSPDAAVTQLIEGAANKDGIAVYGVVSPAEITPFSDLGDLYTGSDTPVPEEYADALETVLDDVTISVDDLATSSQEIGEGLSKVEITGGTLTIDADVDALTDDVFELGTQAFEYATEENGDALAGNPLAGPIEDALDDEDATKAEISKALDEAFPYTIDVDDLDIGDGKKPFLVTVEEGGDWYVSALMTVGEYALVASDKTADRGAMLTDDEIGDFSSPEEAATGLTDALVEFGGSGSFRDLAPALATAESRFLAVYGDALAGDSLTSTGGAGFEIPTSTFSVADKDGDKARLSIDELAVTADGETVTITGTCASIHTGYGTGGKGCLDDVDGASELGLDEISPVAFEEDGRWHVSVLGSFSDAMLVVGEHAIELEKNGTLDETLEKLTGGLAPGDPIAALDPLGTGGYGLDDDYGYDDGYGLDDDYGYDDDSSLDDYSDMTDEELQEELDRLLQEYEDEYGTGTDS